MINNRTHPTTRKWFWRMTINPFTRHPKLIELDLIGSALHRAFREQA